MLWQAIVQVGLGWGKAETQPGGYGGFNGSNMRSREHAEPPEELDRRHRDEALGIECTRPKEGERERHFKPRCTGACRMRNEGDERPFVPDERHAENEAWPNLGDIPEIGQPDLPREGLATVCFPLVEGGEHGVGSPHQLIVREEGMVGLAGPTEDCRR